MKAIIEEGSEETGQKMQMLALAEGAVPIHLVKALFIKSEDNRLLMQRQLSRHLISLWTAGNDAATELLQRILVSWKSVFYHTVGSKTQICPERPLNKECSIFQILLKTD